MVTFEEIRKQIEEYEPQSYLLTWNPKVFQWEDFKDCTDEIRRSGQVSISWSVCTKKIQKNDNIFLMKLGCGDDNGIIGYGKALGSIDDCVYNLGINKKPWFIDVSLSFLNEQPFISQAALKREFPRQCWSPQSSGTRVYDNYTNRLAQLFQTQISLLGPSVGVLEEMAVLR